MSVPDTMKTGGVFHERYRIVRRIKSGGGGAVYEVIDEKTDAPRALKLMAASLAEDESLRQRFLVEAKITGRVESDHVVRTFDVGVVDDLPYIVMELLRGDDLGGVMRRFGPVDPRKVVGYLRQAAIGLDKMHEIGVIHRDLKPENLFVTHRDDGSACVKILDFGIAKQEGEGKTTAMIGTPVYMAPEQITGATKLVAATDRYALAQIAYALLAGEPYYREEQKSFDLFPLLKIIATGTTEAPTARAKRRNEVDLPAAFDAWFERAASSDFAKRFPSSREQVESLARALGVIGGSEISLAVPPASGSLSARDGVRPPSGETLPSPYSTDENKGKDQLSTVVTPVSGRSAPTSGHLLTASSSRDATGMSTSRPLDRASLAGARPRKNPLWVAVVVPVLVACCLVGVFAINNWKAQQSPPKTDAVLVEARPAEPHAETPAAAPAPRTTGARVDSEPATSATATGVEVTASASAPAPSSSGPKVTPASPGRLPSSQWRQPPSNTSKGPPTKPGAPGEPSPWDMPTVQ